MNAEPLSPDAVKLYIPPEDVIAPAFAKANVPVFFGCDSQFFPHALSVIASLMSHASADHNYDILIVQSGIPRHRMAAATEWMRRFPNASLRFIGLGPMIETAARRNQDIAGDFGVEAFFRIFAPTIFANYDKIAYLESDIAVLGDIAEFYHADLGGKILGACHDYIAENQSLIDPALGEFWRRELGKEPGSDYFYSSCAVMDLEEMRERDTESVLLRRIGTFAGRRFPDRDVFNAVMDGEVKFLGSEWNILDWMFDPRELSWNYRRMSDAAREEIRAGRERIKILHYAEKKPWSIDYVGKNASYYWAYAAQTPFFHETLEELRGECSSWNLAKRRIVLALQDVNFRLRKLTAGRDKREKYETRIHNLQLIREGLERQAEIVDGLIQKKDGPSNG